MDFSSVERVFDRVSVHPGHHQHGAIKPVLGDGWNQASVVETKLVDEVGAEGRQWFVCVRVVSFWL